MTCPTGRERLGKPVPLDSDASDTLIMIDDRAARRFQCIVLHAQILFVGRDPCIAYFHGHENDTSF
jgi:hypothetical protein